MASTKQLLDRAKRARMGVVGILESCRCLYPLEQYETATGHHADCPGHRNAMSLQACARPSGYLRLSFDVETPPEIRDANGGCVVHPADEPHDELAGGRP